MNKGGKTMMLILGLGGSGTRVFAEIVKTLGISIGKQTNEFKKYAAKRRESTNNKVYYSGVSFDK